MIRKYRVFCLAVLSRKYTDNELYASSLQNINIKDCQCPGCGQTGSLKKHAEYKRYLICNQNGARKENVINIVRFSCISCHKTHAYIPVFIIPFSVYSLRFILNVLLYYFQKKLTVESICHKFKISVSQLYKWLSLFKKCQKKWICGMEELLCLSVDKGNGIFLKFLNGMLPEHFINYIAWDNLFFINYQHLFGKTFLENTC